MHTGAKGAWPGAWGSASGIGQWLKPAASWPPRRRAALLAMGAGGGGIYVQGCLARQKSTQLHGRALPSVYTGVGANTCVLADALARKERWRWGGGHPARSEERAIALASNGRMCWCEGGLRRGEANGCGASTGAGSRAPRVRRPAMEGCSKGRRCPAKLGVTPGALARPQPGFSNWPSRVCGGGA